MIAELKKKIEPHKNTLVISSRNDLSCLLDVVELEDDYYYKFEIDGTISYVSVVIGYIPLKGFVPNYDTLVYTWNLNRNNLYKAI